MVNKVRVCLLSRMICMYELLGMVKMENNCHISVVTWFNNRPPHPPQKKKVLYLLMKDKV